jgi:UDP-glucose 4-epimerase
VGRLVVPASGGTVLRPHRGFAVSEGAPLRPDYPSYGLGKQLAEEGALRSRRAGFESVILRIGNPYGREASSTVRQGAVDVFLESALNGRSIDIWGDGSQQRDYVFIDDVVDAIGSILTGGLGNQTFNVGTGQGSSLNQVVATVERVHGRTLDRRNRGDGLFRVPVSVLDPSRLRPDRWTPRYDLEQGIAEAWRRLQLARE